MAILATYRAFVAQITVGLSFCRAYFGERYTGFQGLLGDVLAEGARFAVIAHMPGHPEQAEDSLSQSGADAGLGRYRGESLASWRARVADPWLRHESVSDLNLLRELDIWGNVVLPATWDSGQCYVLESDGGKFTVVIPSAMVPWAGPLVYGTGRKFGAPNIMYGISSAYSEDVQTLKRLVRAVKPARSKGRVAIIISGHVYGQPGVTFGGGATYGATVVRIGV